MCTVSKSYIIESGKYLIWYCDDSYCDRKGCSWKMEPKK